MTVLKLSRASPSKHRTQNVGGSFRLSQRLDSPRLYSLLLALLFALGLLGHCPISIWREASNFLKLLRIQSLLGRVSLSPFSIFGFLPLRSICGGSEGCGGRGRSSM